MGDHDHTAPLPDVVLRVKTLESLLVEKKLVDPETLDALIDLYENQVGPKNGARVVARAWADPEFKAWLLADATAAVASFGFASDKGKTLVAVENTPKVHNLVVCTLCSCYPWATLG
ncbi:MAG: nitrile hydratase subunit alpha, partial [Alphaproteobacteria bacterium]